MSREQDILTTLDSITESSKSGSKASDQPSIFEQLQQLDEDNLLKAKKQIDHLVEKKEGEKRRIREQLQMSQQTEEERIDSMFTGI